MARKKRQHITKFKVTLKDIHKANCKGSRETELELTKGFPKGNTIHKDKKAYKRNKKHRDNL